MKLVTMKTRQHQGLAFSNAKNQKGASLLLTVMVLLALTVVALGVTTSNQTQSIMVRNNQFRLEAFNVSFAEIDAQIDALNRRKLSDGAPAWTLKIIDGAVGERVYSSATEASSQIALLTEPPENFMERELGQEFRGACIVFDQQAGEGEEKVRCNEIMIESQAEMVNTRVESDQRQVYEYLTLEEQN